MLRDAGDERDAPAKAASATTLLPPPIAPMPDRSGGYVVRHRDAAAFFTPRGFALSLSGGDGAQGWGLHATLVGAREVAPTAEQEQPGKVHAYVGDRSRWRTALPTYGRLAWEEVLPGTDMIVTPSRGGFSYRFVLSPGADAKKLAMEWAGATSVRAVDDGRGLEIETGIGVLRVAGLRAFAIEGNARRELPARHVVRGTTVAIEVAGWSGEAPLVVDPAVTWSSYLGGAGDDRGLGVAADSSGNVLVTGYTTSADFPTTGGFDKTLGGSQDAFVTKVSAGGALVWSTYLGGAANDYGAAIATDASGAAFVTGQTASTDFPRTTGLDTTLGGTADAFVTKLTVGGALSWSTYLGGATADEGRGIATDASGAVFVTGYTDSTDFPATGAFDTTYNGGTGDAFVVKLSSAGARLWSSFLGGTGYDMGRAIAVDRDGYAIVTGQTMSIAFPTTGGFDTTYGGGSKADAFVTKVSGAGALVWSSYLGGNDHDYGLAIAADASGDVYVGGSTASSASEGFPTTGAFDETLGGTSEGFVTKVSGAGKLLWSSFVGGPGHDLVNGVAVDASGNVLITGIAGATTLTIDPFPILDAFDPTHAPGDDAFVSKVSAGGALRWSSFLGGNNNDGGYAVTTTKSGEVVVVGVTQSSDFPASGGFDGTVAAWDAFVFRLTEALGTACPSAAHCASGFCADGVCCDKACGGACEACSAAKKGSGANGACGPIADGSDPDVECAAATCSGATAIKKQVCNGAGACRSDGTISCGKHLCSAGACPTTCTADGQCVATAYCAAGACVDKRPAGAACAAAGECATGFCADGVCCDTACGGGCEACSAARKGSGVDGVCGNVAADTDPKNACAAGSGPCEADGLCDGAGSCRSFAKAGTPCGATTCTAGTVTGRICKGDSATCLDDSTSCGLYACDASACRTGCTTDADCAPTAFCGTTSTCIPKASNGASCAEGRECASGICADGVCCNSVCAGQCESCDETGAAGTCTAIVGAPRGARPACDALGDTDCAKTTCDGVVRDKCAGYANGTTTPCGAASCTADKKHQKAGACDGHGACAMPEPQNCTPYVCDLAAPSGCKASCASDADCSEGFSCSEGACIQGAKCSADRSASIDKTGNETPCAPYLCGTDGTCLTACAGSDQCAPGSVCDPSLKACVAASPADAGGDEGGCAYGVVPRAGASGSVALFVAALVALGRRRRGAALMLRGRSTTARSRRDTRGGRRGSGSSAATWFPPRRGAG